MLRLKINFSSFWPGFQSDDNYFARLLGRKYDVVLSDSPDLLICSHWGEEWKKYRCPRIFYTGEAMSPDLSVFDFAFSFDHSKDPRHYRLPYYALQVPSSDSLVKPQDFDPRKVLLGKSKFCAFIVSNAVSRKRIQFFHKLSRYKRVDSAGAVFNNMGYVLPGRELNGSRIGFGKIDFLREYKFTIAFENQARPGYTTEKIVHPMLAESIPLYWGDPMVGSDFNVKSFVNAQDFKSDEEMIEYVRFLDNDDAAYLEKLQQPWYPNNAPNTHVLESNVLAQFDRVIQSLGLQLTEN